MGILDDAIRQHLELKRQHGADDTDLDRLEQEAFGPATRPGDPEFETGSEPAVASEPADGEPIADFDAGEEPLSEAPTTVAPQVGDSSVDPEEPSLPYAGPPSAAPELEPEPAEAPAAEELPPEQTPAEQARVEHPHLADTVDHPALEQALPEAPESAPEEPAIDEPEPVEAPEGSIFFDQESGEEAAPATDAPDGPIAAEDEIEEPVIEDFELDEDEPPAVAGEEDLALGRDEAPVTQGPFESGPASPPPQEPAADVSGEEEEFDLDLNLEALDEPPPPAATEGAAPAPPPEPANEVELGLDEELEDEIEDEDEDLLEETPDFLQDAPEGERLWFEQGEPKDFDFDD